LEKKVLTTEFENLLKKVQDFHKNPKTKLMQSKKSELEQITLEADFFKNKKRSQEVYNELKNLDIFLSDLDKLKNLLNDNFELTQIVDEDDVASLDELEGALNACLGSLEQIQALLLLDGEYDGLNAIIEINSGAGGQDAQEWAGILYRMYKQYCQKSGYSIQELNSSEAEGGGYKSVSFLASGQFVYGYLKAEKGVHRLVRISPFDSASRRHTSFASVEVMPEIVDDSSIEIKPDDIRIDTYRSGGAGGQHVNKTDSAVRITHIPTGIVVACQNERSQVQNKETAFKMLRSKLAEKKERDWLDKNKEIKGSLKKIEWGSQIRSYVFQPYTMVKDHRTNFENADVQKVIDGDLHPFILDYLKKSQENT